MKIESKTKVGRGSHALRISTAFVLLSSLSACKWGGTDDCPQCNSHCRVSVWPRLIVGLTDAAAGPATTPLTVKMTTENYTVSIDQADGGVFSQCNCLDHLTDVTCSYTFDLGPAQRDVTLDIWRGDAGLGSCQLHLPEHNYCGFGATAFEITVTGQDQVLCGSQRTLDICPG